MMPPTQLERTIRCLELLGQSYEVLTRDHDKAGCDALVERAIDEAGAETMVLIRGGITIGMIPHPREYDAYQAYIDELRTTSVRSDLEERLTKLDDFDPEPGVQRLLAALDDVDLDDQGEHDEGSRNPNDNEAYLGTSTVMHICASTPGRLLRKIGFGAPCHLPFDHPGDCQHRRVRRTARDV